MEAPIDQEYLTKIQKSKLDYINLIHGQVLMKRPRLYNGAHKI